MSKPIKEYALYKGENLLSIGTAYEIAEQMNIAVKSVLYLQTKSYKKRGTGNNRRILVEIKEEEGISMKNRKEAMKHLLQLEIEEPEWKQLPEDDSRIVELRLLFDANKKSSGPSGKRKKWTKVKAIHNEKVKIYKNTDEACRILDLKMGSLYSSLDTDKKHKGMYFYRVFESEELQV